jgi:hypothetical protein
MRGFEANVGRALQRCLSESVCPGVPFVAADSFDGAELWAAGLGIHNANVCGGFTAQGLARRKSKAD